MAGRTGEIAEEVLENMDRSDLLKCCGGKQCKEKGSPEGYH